ncbi:hypothetical protein [Ligilactobacillus apodemi]|uniref:hypothetical protein n=1 Tax=Ligilactobacillus apodemi TaxID=307126 RepID=UPI00214B4E83|nr:hypothetical protein [Ligilactobacillus apodemi]MCR1901387.1 hypothetical protein [Ligilactobacillus apodemi]
MEHKDSKIAKKDYQVITRTFVVLNILLLLFVVLYDRLDFLQKSPNIIVFFIMLISVFYAGIDFYVTGTLLLDVKTTKDITQKLKSISGSLLGINGLAGILFFLHNDVTLNKFILFLVFLVGIDILVLVLASLALYGVKRIDKQK